MHEEMVDAANRIHSNPLGRLMFGQRELFHSNLLAWYFETLPDEADATFQPWTLAGREPRRSVAREQGNLDLVMLWRGKAPLVIENKVFSIPRRDQLDVYEAATASWENEPSLILLSASEPDFHAGRWRHVDYRQLASSIENALTPSTSYETETMRRYASLARDIDALMAATEVRTDDEPVWIPEPILKSLGSSQLRAALLKARAQRVARHLSRIEDLDDAKGALTRSTPLVERLPRTTIDGVRLRSGWQLQGANFRRSVLFEEPKYVGRDDEALAARVAFAVQHPELFRFPASTPQAHAGRSEFNHFKPDSIYRYVTVKDMTIGDLISAAIDVARDVRTDASETGA